MVEDNGSGGARRPSPLEGWAARYLDAVDSAVLLIRADHVVDANTAAVRLFGDGVRGQRATSLVPALADLTGSASVRGVPAVGIGVRRHLVDVRQTPLDPAGDLIVRCDLVMAARELEQAPRSPWSQLADAIIAAGRTCESGQHPAVALIDLDRFRQVNEVHGRAAGDQVLRVVWERLEGMLRGEERLVALDGDQFGVVGTTADAEELERLGGRLARAIQRPVLHGTATIHLSATLGAAMAPITGPGGEVDRLLGDAEIALRAAKLQGRGRVVIFDDALRTATSNRMELESALVGALARGEFYVEYQPLIDMVTGQALGAEALLRWAHPYFGLVPPDGFLGVAESLGLIDSIGMWVIQEALRVARGWPDHLAVSVNVSALQLRTPGFSKMVTVALARAGLPPERLNLELTESVLVETSPVPMQEIAALREAGIRVGIDDFGTGYASLSYLKHLPVDFIKIDRAFVWGLPTSSIDRAIVISTLAMADALGVEAVAEGVETQEQQHALLQLGCRLAQGFMYARPMRAVHLDPNQFGLVVS